MNAARRNQTANTILVYKGCWVNMAAMYCDPPTKMIQVHFGHASDRTSVATATLETGQRILFSLESSSGNGGFILHLDKKDPVQLCYGPAGPGPGDDVLLGDLTAETTAYGLILPASMPEPSP